MLTTSPSFCAQNEQDVDSSATSVNNEPNQPSPTSVLEASFSNDASSLGSPVEKNGKHFSYLGFYSRKFYCLVLRVIKLLLKSQMRNQFLPSTKLTGVACLECCFAMFVNAQQLRKLTCNHAKA